MYFLSLSLTLETSLWSFGLNMYFEYFKFYQVQVFWKIQTMELELHRVWNLSSKTRRNFEVQVARLSTATYVCIFQAKLKPTLAFWNQDADDEKKLDVLMICCSV